MSRSIQQLPSNSGTTSVTEVYSSTGFNAGDPVYFQNGDYKSPANLTAPTSVSFSFANTSPYNPYGEGGTLFPAFSYAQMQTAGISGGSVRRFAAVLTNGNIVQVWTNHANSTVNTQRPYFRIISTSGTVVVSPTVISTTYSLDYTAISVVALTGGGFAVGWINAAGGTANVVNYAIYSNTGSVVTAATQDTSFSTGGSGAVPIEMTSLANGGFAIAIKNASSVIFIRAYNSTGTGAYSTITAFTSVSNTRSFGFTSRSDSSVCCVDYTSATAINYAIYSSTGTTIVSSTSFAVNSAAYQAGADASVLSDGTTIVFAYYNTTSSNNTPAFRFLPTGNTLGSEIVGIPNANLYAQYSYGGYYIGVLGITGNNVMLFFADGFGNMQYAFYNSSGVCISGSNTNGAIPLQIPGGFAGPGTRITLLESSGSVFAYWNYATNSQIPVQQICAKISTSTYLIVPVLSTAGAPTLVTGQPTGALALNGVTPLGPSYYSTSSSSTVVSNTPSTVIGSTILETFGVDSIASCSLPNGNVVIAYRATTGRLTTAKVLSPVGSVLATIAVSTSASASAVIYGVKVAALSGGGFVVMYAASSNTQSYTLQVYSPTYTVTATTTFTAASQIYQLQFNFDICGLLNNNFAIIFNNDTTNAAVRVYNSALSNIYSLGLGSSPQGMAIAGNSWGGFAVSYFASSTGNFKSFTPTGTSTWSPGSAFTFSMGAYVQNPQMVSTSGMYIITAYSSSGTPGYAMVTDAGTPTIGTTAGSSGWPWGSGSNPTSYPMMGIGLTGNGMVVFATAYSGFSLGIANIAPQGTWSAGQQVPYQQAGSYNLGAMFSDNAYNISSIVPSESAIVRVTPLIGNNCLISYRNSSNYPAFIIVNGNSYSSVYSVTASTTPSAPVPVVPATVSGVISGTFAGVAVTSATAGSTGQLVTNGQALLGASYTGTAAGAFDTTGGAVGGLKGTFNGRSVNLQGNS
jgi:hypothetical protein